MDGSGTLGNSFGTELAQTMMPPRPTPRRFPLAGSGTLWLALLALACHLIPSLQEGFSLRRDGWTLSQGWQVFTCHLSHWSADHFWWDWIVFLGLGWLCERQSRRTFWLTLGSASITVGLGFLLFQPNLASYRGLSGIDSGLFTLWLTMAYRIGSPSLERRVLDTAFAARKKRRYRIGVRYPRRQVNTNRWIYALLGFGFVAKLAFETFSGTTLFVAAQQAGFTPVPLAHLLGALSGATVGVLAFFQNQPKTPAGSAPEKEEALPLCGA